MSSALKYALLIGLVLLLASIPLAMRRDAGKIEGVITNEQGPIAKASVDARNVMSGVVFRTQSDAAGHYQLESIPQGRYSLWVRALAHDQEWIRELTVDQGRTTHRDIRLRKSQPDPSDE